MCTPFRTLIGVFLIVSIPKANATTYLWFDAIPQSSSAGVQNNGAPGTGTTLWCDPTGFVPCDWLITVFFQNDPGDSPIVSWDISMETGASAGKLQVLPTSLSYPPSAFSSHLPASFGVSPGIILGNANGIDNNLFGASSGALARFVLRKTKSPGDFSAAHLNARSGNLVEWTNSSGFYPDMQAGGNTAIAQGGAPDTDLGPVITILNYPEPTASSFALVIAILIHRRWSSQARYMARVRPIK